MMENKIYEKLLNLLKKNALHSSILIHGPQGIGKSHIVQEITKRILKIHQLISPDLRMILSENISIDNIRQVISFSTSTPVNQYKVIILDKIDNMSMNAMNAMLKLIEEPQLNTYIFLVANNLHNIPMTVRSRCLKIPMIKPTLNEFNTIVSSKVSSEKAPDWYLNYLYRVFEGNMNAVIEMISTCDDKLLHKLKNFDIAEMMIELENNPSNKFIIKIILFELANKIKSSTTPLLLISEFERINKEYSKISSYNLSETNAVFSILNSSELVNS